MHTGKGEKLNTQTKTSHCVKLISFIKDKTQRIIYAKIGLVDLKYKPY